MMTVHRLHDPIRRRIILAGDHDGTLALLRFTDGDGPAGWGFEHVCEVWADDREPDGVVTKVVAPRLSDHTVTDTADDGVTVRASIGCPDCGIHGWVTNSRWHT